MKLWIFRIVLVVAIVGMYFSIPWEEHIAQGMETEVKAALKRLANKQEQFHEKYHRFSYSKDSIGFEFNSAKNKGGTSNFDLFILQADSNYFLLEGRYCCQQPYNVKYRLDTSLKLETIALEVK